MSEEKIFVGSGKSKFDGDVIAISLCLTEINDSKIQPYIFTGDDGRRYIKLDVCKRREIDQYGKSHYVKVDTFKPEPRPKAQAEPEAKPEEPSEQEMF